VLPSNKAPKIPKAFGDGRAMYSHLSRQANPAYRWRVGEPTRVAELSSSRRFREHWRGIS